MLRFRDATPYDAAAIARVHVASWRAAYLGQLPAEVLVDLSVRDKQRRWSGRLAGLAQRDAVLVAEQGTGRAGGPVTGDERLLGFAAVGPARDAGSDPTVGELSAICLEPQAFGTGVGHRLHAVALHRLWSAGFRTAVVWVLESNTRAKRFYRRRGWTSSEMTKMERGPGGLLLSEQRLQRRLDPS